MFYAQQVLKIERHHGSETQGWDGLQQSMGCYQDLRAQETDEKLLQANNQAEHKKYKDSLADLFELELIVYH
jgi:hypothetical protein